MVSQKDWEKHCEKLQHQVDCYLREAYPIDFFDESKTTQDCKYQQRVADLRSRYYPIRIAQLLSFFALAVSLINVFFKKYIDLYLKDYINVMVIPIIFVLIIAILWLEKRHVRAQNIIEAAEIKIQYDDINKSKKEQEYFGMYG